MKPDLTHQKADFIESGMITLGLTSEQAKIYKTLSDMGPSKAFRLSLKANVKRSLTYKILSQLEDIGLVESKINSGEKVLTFYAVSPSNLAKLVEKKKEEFLKAENAFHSVIPNLTSAYNLANHKPNARFYEGEVGLKHVFDDILRKKSDLMIFRSVLDNKKENITKMINDQRLKQFKLGIRVKVISPRKPDLELEVKDRKFNIERKYIPEERFSIPAQVEIYGDSVAITSYEEPMITTIIEDKNISESFKVIFSFIWESKVDGVGNTKS